MYAIRYDQCTDENDYEMWEIQIVTVVWSRCAEDRPQPCLTEVQPTDEGAYLRTWLSRDAMLGWSGDETRARYCTTQLNHDTWDVTGYQALYRSLLICNVTTYITDYRRGVFKGKNVTRRVYLRGKVLSEGELKRMYDSLSPTNSTLLSILHYKKPFHPQCENLKATPE